MDRPEMTLAQKAACEALWRAWAENQEDVPGFAVPRDAPQPRRAVAGAVQAQPSRVLMEVVLPEVLKRGPLAAGYVHRWSAAALGRDPTEGLARPPGRS